MDEKPKKQLAEFDFFRHDLRQVDQSSAKTTVDAEIRSTMVPRHVRAVSYRHLGSAYPSGIKFLHSTQHKEVGNGTYG